MFKAILAAALAAATVVASGPARAADYPTRPVRIIVPFAAGGTTDIVARLLANKLAAATGQQFVIENRAGAGGNIGADAVAKAEPDGYTLVMGTVGTHAINPSLYPRMTYDALKDFTPVAFAAGVPNILVVNPKAIKAATVPDFIAEAKSSPRKLNMASSGNGTSIHLSGELFKQLAGVDMVHVPYRGSGPAVNDLVSGQVDLMFDNLPSSIEQVRAGNLRGIAVTSVKRSAALPDLPTVAETSPALKDFEASSWFALFGPANTPTAIVQKVNAEVRKAVDSPELRQRFVELGAEPRVMSPTELGDYVKAELDKWAKVVKSSGAKVD